MPSLHQIKLHLCFRSYLLFLVKHQFCVVLIPYYDSLLVKLSTHAISFKQAEEKMVRSLREMRIRGVKTNI
ncbi:hypothetical protein C7P98_11305, partial [Staphylococcus aureus]